MVRWILCQLLCLAVVLVFGGLVQARHGSNGSSGCSGSGVAMVAVSSCSGAAAAGCSGGGATYYRATRVYASPHGVAVVAPPVATTLPTDTAPAPATAAVVVTAPMACCPTTTMMYSTGYSGGYGSYGRVDYGRRGTGILRRNVRRSFYD